MFAHMRHTAIIPKPVLQLFIVDTSHPSHGLGFVPLPLPLHFTLHILNVFHLLLSSGFTMLRHGSLYRFFGFP